jgi:hypothetical protein
MQEEFHISLSRESYANCLVAHETMEKVIIIKSEAYVTTLKESASA